VVWAIVDRVLFVTGTQRHEKEKSQRRWLGSRKLFEIFFFLSGFLLEDGSTEKFSLNHAKCRRFYTRRGIGGTTRILPSSSIILVKKKRRILGK
jgi:hypothetical protein